MSDIIRKQFDITRKGDEIIVNTGAFDREHDRVLPSGAKLDNYLRNPIMLWGHNYHEPGFVIGTAKDIRSDGRKIIVRPDLREPASDNDPMHIIRALWDAGIIRTASIGFLPLAEPKRNEKGGYDYEEWELLEISLVPVPANQEALRLAVKGLGDNDQGTGMVTMTIDEFGDGEVKVDWEYWQSNDLASSLADDIAKILLPQLEARLMEIIGRGVIPYKRHPLAPEDTPWDGPAEVRKADVDDLRIMCAWFDSSNPDVKASYKLPHHRADDHYTVWSGVRAAMAALLGARGGVNIPDADRRGVYNHLARHYRDFDKEPPEFRDYSPDELKQMFPDFYDRPDDAEKAFERMAAMIDQLFQQLKEMANE